MPLLDQPGIKLKQICYTVCRSSIHTTIVLDVAFACSVWTAGLRSYVSSEKQLVCADWQLIALWFNLVRDFQKCCVHSDLEIGAPCSLCVQNFNAPKKGDKGAPWWCHYPVSKQALSAGWGGRTGPSTMAPAFHPDPLWANVPTSGVKFKTDWHKFKIFLTLKPISAHRNSNPHKWYVYVMFLMICVTPANSQLCSVTISTMKVQLPIWTSSLNSYIYQGSVHTWRTVYAHVTLAAVDCVLVHTSACGWPIVWGLYVKTPIICYQTRLHIWISIDAGTKL